jgi:hypothetical protein
LNETRIKRALISVQESMTKLWQRIEFDDKSKPDDDDSDANKEEIDPTKTDHSVVVDPCCMILSNLTIDPENCELVWRGFVQVNTWILFNCNRTTFKDLWCIVTDYPFNFTKY